MLGFSALSNGGDVFSFSYINQNLIRKQASKYSSSSFFFFFKIDLFMIERESQRHRQREKQAPRQEPDTGLDPRTPGPQDPRTTPWPRDPPFHDLSVQNYKPHLFVHSISLIPALRYSNIFFKKSLSLSSPTRIKAPGDPWVAQLFGTCLWPGARSWSPGMD